ncbi:MAG TPA: nuclease A inhibitor family protein [Pyrinomonadaceae bacterium]|jgi:hypothetical protein
MEGRRGVGSGEKVSKLVRLLTENLAGVRVYRVSQINSGVYVIGRNDESNCLGVSTRMVET